MISSMRRTVQFAARLAIAFGILLSGLNPAMAGATESHGTPMAVMPGAIHDWNLADHFRFGLGALYDFDFAPSSPTASYGGNPHGTMVFVQLVAE